MKGFRELLESHIDLHYDGNAAEFSRATGFTTQTVSAWRRGKVTLPQIDTRRRLAKELGMSHIDLLVSLGELSEDEAQSGDKSESPVMAALRPILDSADLTESEIRLLRGHLKSAVDMLKGNF